MSHRRDFLKQAGWLSALALLGPARLGAMPAPAAPGALAVGLQLYTLRDYLGPGQDVSRVLAQVARAGYQDVETYGYGRENQFWGLTPAALQAALAAVGLRTSSGHYDLTDFIRDGHPEALQACLDAANGCGQAYVVVPSVAESLRRTPADFRVVADQLNRAGERCRAAGLRLAYHNHDFEFKPVDGTSLYEVLLRETQPGLVDFELDLYWAVRAGQDPVALLDAHPQRFRLWHVKDMDRAQPARNTEVGRGSIDFKKIFQHAKAAGLTHIFMEQENFTLDPYRSIAQSAAYIKQQLL